MEKDVIFQTHRLELRYFREGDFGPLFSYRSDPDVARFQCYESMTGSEVKRMIGDYKSRIYGAPGEWTQYAIASKSTGRLAGDCAVFKDELPGVVEIGVTINPAYQRRGIAGEALRSLIAWLSVNHNVHLVTAVTDRGNTAYRALLSSLLFRETQETISHAWKNKSPEELVLYKLHIA